MNKSFDSSSEARRKSGKVRRRIAIEPLEERILLSVDLVPYAPDKHDDLDAFYEREIEPARTAVEQTEQGAEDAAARELVLFDQSLGNLSSLTAALSDVGFGVIDRKEMAVVGSRDDIVAALSSGVRYDAIHWISHGSAEGLQLGNELLAGDIAADDPVVTALTRALGPDSDLMLYACDLAAGELPHRLAVLTGADVAASINVTGAEGDWDLEVAFGQIETAALDLGDAVSSLSMADILTNVLSGTAVTNDTPFADMFATGRQFEGVHVPASEDWVNLPGAANVDPLTELGATSAEAIENAVGWLEAAILAAGEDALRAEIKALPDAEQATLFALTSIGGSFDDSNTHVNAIIDVLADGAYLGVNGSTVSSATLNRLMAAYSSGAETVRFGVDTGSSDSALVVELKSLVPTSSDGITKDLLTKRLLSLFSGMKATLDLKTDAAAPGNSLTVELVLDGSLQGLPEGLNQGFETARGQITLTAVFDATGVDQSAETELELRTITEVSTTLATGTTALQLSNVPNVAVPAHVRLGNQSVDLWLDATGQSLAAALKAALEAETGFPSELTITVSGNSISFANTGAAVDFALFLNKTGVRSATLTDNTTQTITLPPAAPPSGQAITSLPVRFSLAFMLNGVDVTRSYDAVLDTDGQTVAEALAANLDFAAQAAAAGLTVTVSGDDLTLTLPSGDDVVIGFEIRETATLYNGAIGTGFFARDPQVDLERTKLYVRSLTEGTGTTPDDSAWVMALPLDFGDSFLGAQFSNTYTIGGHGTVNPDLLIDGDQLYAIVDLSTELQGSSDTGLAGWLEGLSRQVSLDHPVGQDGLALLGLQSMIESLRSGLPAITKGVVTPAGDKAAVDPLQLPVLRSGEAFVDTPEDGFGDLLGIGAQAQDPRSLLERQIADLTSLPGLMGIGAADGLLPDLLEGLADAIARAWAERTVNDAAAVHAAVAAVSADFALAGLVASGTGSMLDAGAVASPFVLGYDGTTFSVDLNELLVAEENGVRAVWGEVPLLQNIGERTADLRLSAALTFTSTYETAPAGIKLDLGAEVISADDSLSSLDVDLPGDPRIAMDTLRLELSQGFVLGATGWDLDDNDTDTQAKIAFELKFTDPRGESGTFAHQRLNREYTISLADVRALRVVNTGHSDLFDVDDREALYWLQMRAADTMVEQGFVNALLAMPELKGIIPILGKSIAEMLVNDAPATAAQPDLQNYLVNVLGAALSGMETPTELGIDLDGLLSELATGPHYNNQAFDATDGVMLEFLGENLSLPEILIDFTRLSNLMLSGAMFRETPQASVRMRMRLQHALEQRNSYSKSANGTPELVLSEDRLRFDTWFEPLGTSGSTPKIFDFALDFDQSSIEGGPLTIDLGTLGKQTIQAPQFALNVGFRPELVSGTQKLPGAEAPRLSPLLTDTEAQLVFMPVADQEAQDFVRTFSAEHGLGSADIGKIYIDDTGARFRLTEIVNSDMATFRSLDRPVDATQTSARAPVGGLTPPAAFYELILPINYAGDGVDNDMFSPRFIASGFDEIVAGDPRLLLVNDSEWEMKTLLDEAADRFSGVWLQRDGALSQFDQLLRQSVGSTDGLSGFMTQGMELLHGKSFIDLIEDPAASVDFDTGLAAVITQHLDALNNYTPEALPKHFTGAPIHSDLRAYVDELAEKLSEITGLQTDKLINLAEVTTGNSTSASTLQEMDDTLSADGRLLEEIKDTPRIRYIFDLITEQFNKV